MTSAPAGIECPGTCSTTVQAGKSISLIAKGDATLDPAKRRKIFQEAQRLLAEEGGVIVPAFASVSAAMRKECSGYEPNNNVNNNDFSNFQCE